MPQGFSPNLQSPSTPTPNGAVGEINTRLDQMSSQIRNLSHVLWTHANNLIGPPESPPTLQGKVEEVSTNTMGFLRKLDQDITDLQQVFGRLGIYP